MTTTATASGQAQLPAYQGMSDSGLAAIRYRLIVVKRTDGDAAIRVFDCVREYFLLDWQGALVRHLFESGILPAEFRRSGCFVCEKSFVWHLLLAGAATKMMLDQVGRLQSRLTDTLARRLPFPANPSGVDSDNRCACQVLLPVWLNRAGVQLAGPHRRIASILLANPGYHFSAEDVRCLLLLECLPVTRHQVYSWLDDLVHWSVVRRIEVDSENIFYGVDISLAAT